MNAGDLSGRSLFFLPHRAEALCFVRAAFQAEGLLRNDGRLPKATRNLVSLRRL